MPVFDINAIPVFRKLHRTKSGKTKSRSIAGRRFTKLLAVSLLGMSNDAKHRATWLFRCDCGKFCYYPSDEVISGRNVSCGCVRRAQNEIWKTCFITHGMRHTKTYDLWCNMLARCNNPRTLGYENYGGRGITVHQPWLKFKNFLADMGTCPPEKTSLDRIKPNDNYGPGKCRWADKWEQAANRRNNRYITIGDETYHTEEWSRRRGINSSKIRARLNIGWTPEEALEFAPRQVSPMVKNR